jgi:hypothetical protein
MKSTIDTPEEAWAVALGLWKRLSEKETLPSDVWEAKVEVLKEMGYDNLRCDCPFCQFHMSKEYGVTPKCGLCPIKLATSEDYGCQTPSVPYDDFRENPTPAGARAFYLYLRELFGNELLKQQASEAEDRLPSSDDLWYAMENNPCDVPFSQEQVKAIIAEVCGANDECDWWWVLKVELPEGTKYALVSGGCDYTGWDCQSSMAHHGFFDTALEAAKEAPDADSGGYMAADRNIRYNLVGQIEGKIPFAEEVRPEVQD